MTTAKTISDILDATLAIESKDSDHHDEQKPKHEISTSRILLNRIREEASSRTDNFLQAAPLKSQPIDPLLSQIAESQTDPPKYWNGSPMKTSFKESSTLSLKAQEIISSQINNPAGYKKKQVKKHKGEAYSDRLQTRVASHQHRRQRLDKYSNIH